MLNQVDIENIKKTVEDFFQRITFSASCIEAVLSCANNDSLKKEDENKIANDVIEINIKLEDPQILIGERGQTLSEIQRLLKIILNKRLQKIFYLNIDINDYKKKKIEYLKKIANDLANEVVLAKEEKVLFPMPAYERRIIHTELMGRLDVFTESRGYSIDRCVVIKPR